MKWRPLPSVNSVTFFSNSRRLRAANSAGSRKTAKRCALMFYLSKLADWADSVLARNKAPQGWRGNRYPPDRAQFRIKRDQAHFADARRDGNGSAECNLAVGPGVR